MFWNGYLQHGIKYKQEVAENKSKVASINAEKDWDKSNNKTHLPANHNIVRIAEEHLKRKLDIKEVITKGLPSFSSS